SAARWSCATWGAARSPRWPRRWSGARKQSPSYCCAAWPGCANCSTGRARVKVMRNDPADREQRLDAVLVACLEAIDAGQAPDRTERLARYPEFAAELTRFLEDQSRVERCAAPLRQVVQRRAADAAEGLAAVAPQTELGDFRILREIGRGGMGVVYEAEQT